ncbi:MAG: phosphatase PAP2 family protein [Chloroflexi bacterium]|nr:phosphatase PAP2 family protein [Chloroflexota bacterium]
MNRFDTEITLWLNGLVGDWGPLDWTVRILAGDYLIPPLFALVIIGTIFAGSTPEQRHEWQRAAFRGVMAIALSNWAIFILNGVWDRARPYIALPDDVNLLFYPATDPSFPANPTAVGFAVAGALWRVSPRLRYSLMALGLIVGFARVYVGVFYATDVIGAAALGFALAYIAGWIYRVFDPALNLALRVARAFAVA